MSNRQAALIAPRIPDSQSYLVITDAGHQKGLIGKKLVSVGALTEGVYTCKVSVEGMAELNVALRTSALTGTIAPVMETRWLDGTQRTAGSGAGNFVNTTQQDLQITGLKGQKTVWVVITVGSGESITFDRAEYNGQ